MRDLQKDLELCNAVTLPKPWMVLVDDDDDWCVTDATGTVICHSRSRIANARFIAEACEGWPEAIQRAMAAEKNALCMAMTVLEDDRLGYILSKECLEMARTLSRMYKKPKETNKNA